MNSPTTDSSPHRPAVAAEASRPGWMHTLGWSGALLAIVAIAMRINNAVRYPPRWGLDALFNEQYIDRLLASYALPAPDAGWSTAHPPLFYYLSAALARLSGAGEALQIVVPTRLVSAAAGLGIGVLAFWLVARLDPGRPQRARLALGLVLFVPVHIYMSAMLSEEILAALFISLAITLGALAMSGREQSGREQSGREQTGPAESDPWRAGTTARDVAIGVFAGLALLTKLSGLLVIPAVGGAFVLLGLRERRWAPALRRAAVIGSVALLVGGWYYARNLAVYGYLYPQDLEAHAVMFTMPPGERHIADYLRFPLATFSDPQVLAPDLLRSVWGSTYVTLWYEGHGHFLPERDPRVLRFGGIVLVLALLPCAAFGIGALRALRRARHSPRGPDAPLLLLSALTLAGYVAFTWTNPWFATVKGSYLLGMSVPFAYFASDVLTDWTAAGGLRAVLIWGLLALLLISVCVAFTYGIGIWNLTAGGDLPGVQWSPVEPR